MVRAGLTLRGSRIPRGTRLASVVRIPLTARPAPKNLLGGSAPNFGGNGALHTMVYSCRCSSATSSRDTFGERAKNSDSTTVRAAIRTPSEWYVLNILLFQHAEIRAIVIHLALEHGSSAVRSSADGVRRRDAYIQSGDCITQCLGEDVCGAELRAGDEPGDLGLGGRVALLKTRK